MAHSAIVAILVASLLAVQSLSLGHLHSGTGIDAPPGHAHHRHFHIRGIDGHPEHPTFGACRFGECRTESRHKVGGHDQDEIPVAFEPIAAHDDDAAYLADSSLIGADRQSTHKLPVKVSAFSLVSLHRPMAVTSISSRWPLQIHFSPIAQGNPCALLCRWRI